MYVVGFQVFNSDTKDFSPKCDLPQKLIYSTITINMDVDNSNKMNINIKMKISIHLLPSPHRLCVVRVWPALARVVVPAASKGTTTHGSLHQEKL